MKVNLRSTLYRDLYCKWVVVESAKLVLYYPSLLLLGTSSILANFLDIIGSDNIQYNIIIVPSRRMLLLPPKNNIGRSTFPRQEELTFAALTQPSEDLAGLRKPDKTHTRNPKDL